MLTVVVNMMLTVALTCVDRTSGCTVGESLTAIGGGGAGFHAVIRCTDSLCLFENLCR